MIESKNNIGSIMYKWATELFPINRSLTGEGVRETLNYIKNIIPDLSIKSLPSGKKVFDWEIPDEWNVTDAYIITPEGNKITDFKKNNLHLVGYSIPLKKTLSLEELLPKLYSLEELPDAIPYITSYYNKDWGFCISDKEKKTLKEGEYKIHIDSTLKPGLLNYAEILIPGIEEKEILISTYICHPSMCNNELSGPVVTIQLVNWLKQQKNLRYTYRVVFVPETIGSIAYIHENFSQFKKDIVAGFVVTCVGDNNNYSILKSKWKDSLIDRVGINVMQYHTNGDFKEYDFLERGSDERQYSSVGVDIPVINLMRSKYGEYKEYHTSLDNLDFISEDGLLGGFEIHRKAIFLLENNFTYKVYLPCEPQLGKRGLYPKISSKNTNAIVKNMMNFIAYADGTKDLIEIATLAKIDALECVEIANKLYDAKVLLKI